MTRGQQVRKMLERKKGIWLDISFGGEKQPNSVQLGPSGDVKCDIRLPKWPLPDACVHTANFMHVLEYIKPEHFFDWFDELWRVMKPWGLVHGVGPYGGDDSSGWLSDPTHQTRILEQTFLWLDPRGPLYELHPQVGRKIPKPWLPQGVRRVPGSQDSISYNVTLKKAEVQR